MNRVILIALVTSVSFAACGQQGSKPAPASAKKEGDSTVALTIRSSAFAEGERIPKKYTCDGEDLSPPLTWSGVPQGAKSLALICDDPDAPMGTWVHWVAWGIPPSAPGLPEGVPTDRVLPGGIQQGLNSWPKTGYGGPCPPPGKPHRYFFKLYALDALINPAGTPDKAALEKAMQGHILSEAQLMGRYGR